MYKNEFPDYDDELYVPIGFVDGSWHNDACPRATKILKDDPLEKSLIEINIWQEYKDPDKRENPEHSRFVLSIEVDFAEVFSYATDNLDEIKKMVEQNLFWWDWLAISNKVERS